MKTILRAIPAVIFLLSLSFGCYAEKPMKLVCIRSFPPYAWVENGQLKGIDVDIIEELFKRAGLKKEITPSPPLPIKNFKQYFISFNVFK